VKVRRRGLIVPGGGSHLTIPGVAAVIMVDRGEAGAAVCFRTDLHGDERSVVVGMFPSDSHAPIACPVALTRAPHNPRAADALAFLRTPKVGQIFADFGYQPPPA
jgi:molybdate transport system substrate-binding protein